MLSRRKYILRLSALAGTTLAPSAFAQTPPQPAAKVTQADARYQSHPNNMQMCGMCKFYIPAEGQSGHGMMGGGGMMGGQMGCGMMGRHMGAGMMAAGDCQLVEGSISPMGWCVLYRPTNS